MSAHVDTLISMIDTLKSLEKQLSGLAASNREQIGKAHDYLGDGPRQVDLEEALAIKNRSFS